VIAPLLAAAAALAPLALPQGAARYRAELAGVPVGVAELSISCEGARCMARHASRLRLPAEAGGGVRRVEVELPVDREGRFRDGEVRVERDGVRRGEAGIPGAVPAALVETVLAGLGEGCVPFFEEERPSERVACAGRGDGAVAADVGGVHVRIVPGEDGFPREVEVGGRFRFVRDASAEVPPTAPRLAGTRVAGPSDPGLARRFCGVPRDPSPGAAAVGAGGLPAPRAAGASCREKTRAWIAATRAQGFLARAAVGVAWDGAAFVWHEWAEARVQGGWLAVDPSFGQRPAQGPRFTLARFEEDDAAARDAAGEKILACWGAARVE
jgi:hypothetical protein